MNRKQLEDCAWKKTPKDERRDRVETTKWSMRTGQPEKTTFRKLTGNSREVLVFDPSGSTEGTINPYVPLWSLYSDELEQRCRDEKRPKLRAPYNRMRADYTGDVESSPGTKATREGASQRHHATKKKKKKKSSSRAKARKEIRGASITTDYFRGQTYGDVEWDDGSRTSGPLNTHMRALLERARREGKNVRHKTIGP